MFSYWPRTWRIWCSLIHEALVLKLDFPVDINFKQGSNCLQFWPWSWVCIVELWVLHIISLRRTFDPNLINIFQRVQEIWSEHEIQSSNTWPFTVTLTLSRHAWVMGSAHRLTKANIWPKFHENLSKGSGDMERTRKRRMTFKLWPWPWVCIVEL